MVDLFFNVALGKFVRSSNSIEPIQRLAFRGGRDEAVRLFVVEGELDAPPVFLLHNLPGNGQVELAKIDTDDWTEEDDHYSATMVFSSPALVAMLGTAESVQTYGQLIYSAGEEEGQDSQMIVVIVHNKLGEAAPVTVDWSNVENKPSEFPPSAHRHDVSDIDGLGSAATEDSSAFATASQGGKADSALQAGDVVDNLTTADSYKVLSAKQGKELQDGKVGLDAVSDAGGANKVPQFDAAGNLILGPYANSGATAFGGVGNVAIPDQQGFYWLNPFTGEKTAQIRHWHGHDAQGGETLYESVWRMAFICPGPVQFGNNASLRNAQFLHMVSGATTEGDPIRESKAISFQTRTRAGGVESANNIMMQAVPLDATGTNSVLRIFRNAEVTDSAGGLTSNTGKVAGTVIAEIGREGLWSPGTSPAFDALADDTTITLTCSKYKTVQAAKVTLGGNRTLAFSGLEAGMRGVLYLNQDASGGRALAFPANSAFLSGFAISTDPLSVDRLSWEYDGDFIFWTIVNDMVIPLDDDAASFIAAASLTNDVQKAAVNALVLSLKTNGLWSKLASAWPFVGGDATAHSKDLLGTHNITWNGSLTHDAAGVTGDGASGYGNTGLMASALSQDDCGIYVYCKTESPTNNTYFIGATNGLTSRALLGPTAGGLVASLHATADDTQTVSSNYRRHLAAMRRAAGNFEIFVNATKSNPTRSSVPPYAGNLYLLARNSIGSPNGYTNANLAFSAVFSAAPTESEYAAFRSAIDNFQTALGRKNP